MSDPRPAAPAGTPAAPGGLAPVAAPAHRDRSLFARAGAFLLLAVAVDLWLVQHVGRGFGDVLKFGGLAAVVTGGMGRLDRMLSDADRERVRQPLMRLASLGRLAITTPGLIVLYVVALVVGMSQSSIRVVLPDGTAPLSVKLTPVATALGQTFEYRASAAKDASPRRVPTTPFGTTYRVEVPGYLPKLVRVPPLTGAVVDADEDLRRVPMILLRVPVEALSTAGDGSRLRVLRGDSVVAQGVSRGGSYVLGRMPKLEQRVATWRMEATARVGPDQPIDAILLKWHNVWRLQGDYLPAQGDTLDVRLSDRHDHLLAKTQVAVGSEDLIDVEMMYVSETPP